MELQKSIEDLNEKTKNVYTPRPQKRINPHLSQLYPMESDTEKAVLNISSLFDCSESSEDLIKTLTCDSLVALAVAPLTLQNKKGILKILMQWAFITDVDDEILAGIIQSLRFADLHFNELYAIRTALYNYLTKPSLNEETILRILPSGKLDLQSRQNQQFNGDACLEYTYVLSKLQKVTSLGVPTMFKTLTQYDFRRTTYFERSHQIVSQLSDFKVSGFVVNDINGNRFATGFGKAINDLEVIGPPSQTMSHYTVVENYANGMEWVTGKRMDRILVQRSMDTPKNTDYGEYEEEEEEKEEEEEEEEDESDQMNAELWTYDSGYDGSPQLSPTDTSSETFFDFSLSLQESVEDEK
ncbi:unnamed protein product [Caenorhabditis nigoni]